MQIHSVCTNEKSTILLVVSQKAAKERRQLERELKASHMQEIIGRFSLDAHRQDDCSDLWFLHRACSSMRHNTDNSDIRQCRKIKL